MFGTFKFRGKGNYGGPDPACGLIQCCSSYFFQVHNTSEHCKLENSLSNNELQQYHQSHCLFCIVIPSLSLIMVYMDLCRPSPIQALKPGHESQDRVLGIAGCLLQHVFYLYTKR